MTPAMELYTFSTGEELILTHRDRPSVWLRYGCMTIRNTICMVVYEMTGSMGYRCFMLVIDEENGLITRADTTFGAYLARPHLAKTEYTFGEVKWDGEALPWRRQSFTTELTGKNCLDLLQWLCERSY